jgi:hypothetical protein
MDTPVRYMRRQQPFGVYAAAAAMDVRTDRSLCPARIYAADAPCVHPKYSRGRMVLSDGLA